jgi:hypothetical protein
MLYHVSGCSRIDGQDRTIEIEAPTPRAAEAIAGTHGIFVSAVRVPGQATPLPPPDDTIDMTPQPPPVVMQCSRRGNPASAPSYLGILVGVFAINVSGGMTLALAIIFFVLGARQLSAHDTLYDGAIFTGPVMLIQGLAAAGFGTFLLLIGSAAMALRDMARNSYRW